MNQKDYKKIAEIMKDYKQYVDEIQKKDDRAFIAFRCSLDNLADYFEEEEKMEKNKEHKETGGNFYSDLVFSRVQFLKLCGVEE